MPALNLFLLSLGVLAIAAPLYVHLRLGKVKKRMKVSSLHLMLAARQTSQTPRRIVNWPLFLLRCLVLLLVAFGFARLLIPWLGSGSSRDAYAVFIIDVSGSMQAKANGASTWDDAQKRLQQEISKLAPSSRVAIITSPSGNQRPTWESPSEAARRAANLVPGYSGNRLATELRLAATMLAEMPDDHPKELRVISDFQNSALAGVDQVALPANLELKADKVGPLQARNRGLTVSVQSAGTAGIRLYAFTDGTSGKIGLTENGQLSSLEIEPGRGATRPAGDGAPNSWVARKLVLEEEDALAVDNVAYDVFQAQETIPVWLYEPRGKVRAAQRTFRSAETRVAGVTRAFDQASYYLGTALQPAFAGGEQSQSRFRPVLLVKEELPGALGKAGEPGSPNLLFVPATNPLPAGLADLAKAITAKGGAVVFFSGPEVDAKTYQAAFGPLLPVELGRAGAAPPSPSLAAIDDRHPLWGSLDVRTRRQLAKVGLRERSSMELAAGGRALAYYSDAMPFIAERMVGQGRVYFVNTTADRGWGDWPADPPLFVPTIHLLAARSLGMEARGPADQPLVVGESVSIPVDPSHAGKTVRLGETEHTVDATGRIDAVVFTEPGIFDLALPDGSLAGRVAANIPAGESVLDSYAEPVVLQRLASLRQTSSQSVVRWKEGLDNDMAAWKWCLALAALALLIEPVLANRKAQS